MLERCAGRVMYVGSVEHKSYPSFAGAPKLRSNATRCPRHLKDQEQITGWLRDAVRRGYVSEAPGPESFPRYVWARQEETWFEARLVNVEQGHYKGYPLGEHEAPIGLNAGDPPP